MKMKNSRKGIEGMPLKYLLIILVAAIILTAMFAILAQFSASALAITQNANSTLHDVLNNSLSRALR